MNVGVGALELLVVLVLVVASVVVVLTSKRSKARGVDQPGNMRHRVGQGGN